VSGGSEVPRRAKTQTSPCRIQDLSTSVHTSVRQGGPLIEGWQLPRGKQTFRNAVVQVVKVLRRSDEFVRGKDAQSRECGDAGLKTFVGGRAQGLRIGPVRERFVCLVPG